MSGDDRGPSWWDVAQYVDDLQSRRGFRAQLVVSPPVRKLDKSAWSSWSVAVTKPAQPGKPTTGLTETAYFGKGGAWRTAPAALLDALIRLDARLAEKEDAKRRQATF